VEATCAGVPEFPGRIPEFLFATADPGSEFVSAVVRDLLMDPPTRLPEVVVTCSVVSDVAMEVLTIEVTFVVVVEGEGRGEGGGVRGV
jgi:hypothetical protein